MVINIRLSKEDFQHLTQGGELQTEQNGVQVNMILADIGYVTMHECLDTFLQKPSQVNKYKDFSEVRSHG